MAVSASAIDESTFIWNPNLIALSSAIALAGAWQAWTTRRARWWLLRRRRDRRDDAVPRARGHAAADRRGAPASPTPGDAAAGPGPTGRPGAAGAGRLAIIALAYVPLVVHELTTRLLRDARRPRLPRAAAASRRRVGRRCASLVVAGAGRLLAADRADHRRRRPPPCSRWSLVVAIVVWRWRSRGRPAERVAVRWLGLGLALDGRVPDVRGVRAGRRSCPACRTTTTTRSPTRWSSRSSGSARRRAWRAWRRRSRAPAAARRRPVRASVPRRRGRPSPLVGARRRGTSRTQPPAVAPDGGFPAAAAAAQTHRGGRRRSSDRAPLAARTSSRPTPTATRWSAPDDVVDDGAPRPTPTIARHRLRRPVRRRRSGPPAAAPRRTVAGAAPFAPAGSSGGRRTHRCSGSRRRRAAGSRSTDRPEGGASRLGTAASPSAGHGR